MSLKSSALVKYSSPKTSNIELMNATFCMIANDLQSPEPYRNKV